MSEYQYYDFRAVDRRLTKEEIAELERMSTRAEITPTSFTNFYSFGDFKGNPEAMMGKYFDAFLYGANWGHHQLMLRFPIRAVDVAKIQEYAFDKRLTIRKKGEFLLLSVDIHFEPVDWSEFEGVLSEILPVREEILRGDYRALYIIWLAASMPRESEWDDYDEEDVFADQIEPPVPPGLGEHGAARDALADFLRVEESLLNAAAQASPPLAGRKADPKALDRWVAKLPLAEKESILRRFLGQEGEHPAALRLQLLRQFEASQKPLDTSQPRAQRTLGAIRAIAKEADEVARQKEAERLARVREEQRRADQAARRTYLANLARNELAKWAEVETLVAAKKSALYDEAVKLLVDLREVAAADGRDAEADSRIADLRLKHEKKTSFIERLRNAKLVI